MIKVEWTDLDLIQEYPAPNTKLRGLKRNGLRPDRITINQAEYDDWYLTHGERAIKGWIEKVIRPALRCGTGKLVCKPTRANGSSNLLKYRRIIRDLYAETV